MRMRPTPDHPLIPRRQVLVALLLTLMGATACSDDKGNDYPPVVTDLVTVAVASNGWVSNIFFDEGATYDVTAQHLVASVPDTLLRCLASYTLTDGTLHLYGLTRIFSDRPYPASEFLTDNDGNPRFDSLPRDPVHLVSLWKSGNYLNMQLGILTTGVGTHAYAFCEDSLGHYSLVHLRPEGDAESYTQKTYLSMPIPDSLNSFTFSLRTYDGTYARTF